MAGNELILTIKTVKTGTGAEDTEEELSGIEKATQAAGAALVAFATVEVARATFELAELGAQAARTESSFIAISGGTEKAAANMAAMQGATRGALSEVAAMSAANQLMQMGLATNAEELARVTTLAVRLGTAMGGTAAESIESFSLLLANQSIPRLDTFGISASNVRKRIAELQAQTPGMSREMAFMTATFAEGDIAMARLGEQTDDMALSFERMDASIEDLKASTGKLAAAFGVDMVDEVTVATDALNENINVLELLLLLTPAAGLEMRRLRKRFFDTTGEAKTFAETLEEDRLELLLFRAASNQAGQSTLSFTEQMAIIAVEAEGAIGGVSELTGATDANAEASAAAAETSRDWIKALDEFEIDNEQIWKLAAATDASAESLAALAEQLGISSSEEIIAAQRTQELFEMLDAGLITVPQFNTQMQLMALGLDGVTVGTTATTDAMINTNEAVAKAKVQAGLAAIKVGSLGEAMTNLPALTTSTIRVKTEYVGGPPPPGLFTGFQDSIPGAQAGGTVSGVTRVGEGGAELAVFPFGTRVVSHSEARSVLSNDNRSFGGNTTNVFVADSAALGALQDQRRMDIMQQLTG